MNRVKINCTKDKFKTLRIFITILAIIFSIIIVIKCTNYNKERVVVSNQKKADKIINELSDGSYKNITAKFDILKIYTTNPITISQGKIKNNINTLKLSKIVEHNSQLYKKVISKVSNKSTKKVTTKITPKNISKVKKVSKKKTKSKKTKKLKSTVWKLEIPKIGLNASIAEGTSQSVLNKYIGHFTETLRQNGNVGLAAHNRGFAVNYFSKLNKLSKNDIIYYTYKGVRKKYKVVYKKRIQATDWSKLYYTNDERITMITCVKNKPHLRLCVQAKRVK